MAVTASDMRTRFPEFASLDTATIERWLDEASRNHNQTQWAGKSDDGLAWLTAHFLASYGSGCTTDFGPGPLTSTAQGRTSASFALAKAFTKNDIGTTKYGRRYLSLLQTIFPTRCV